MIVQRIHLAERRPRLADLYQKPSGEGGERDEPLFDFGALSAKCDEEIGPCVRIDDRLQRRFGFLELERRLREAIRTDPLRLAPHVDARRLLLFVALADRTIGTANGLRLRRALGYPRTVFLPLGHYTSYLMLPYIKRRSLAFFRQQLGEAGP